MARGINKVIIVGNLGNDPEMRTFPDGGAITNISVATSEAWKDKQTGQQQERTEWHRVVFRGRLAEIASQYLRKGSKVYIEGSLRTNKYQDKQTGQDRYSTDIVAREMQMLDSRTEGMTAPQQGGYQQAAPAMAAPQTQAPQQQAYQQQPVAPQTAPVAPQTAPAPQAAPQQNYAAPQAAPMQQAPAQGQPQAAPANNFDDFDDDIPF